MMARGCDRFGVGQIRGAKNKLVLRKGVFCDSKPTSKHGTILLRCVIKVERVKQYIIVALE